MTCSRLPSAARWAFAGGVLVVIGALSSSSAKVAAGQEPADKPAANDLDDALLKDLDNELLEGAGAKPQRPAKPPGKKPPGKKPPRSDVPPAPEMLDGEDVGQPSADQDPLMHISDEMRMAEQWMTEGKRAPHAQQVQQRIVEDLARLIRQAEQQQQAQQQSGKSQNKPGQKSQRQSAKQSQPMGGGQAGGESNKPAQDSTDRMGKAEAARPDPKTFQRLLKDSWGHLPERDREQVLQHSPEQFLPQYELLIERYYKRLSEQQRPSGR